MFVYTVGKTTSLSCMFCVETEVNVCVSGGYVCTATDHIIRHISIHKLHMCHVYGQIWTH